MRLGNYDKFVKSILYPIYVNGTYTDYGNSFSLIETEYADFIGVSSDEIQLNPEISDKIVKGVIVAIAKVDLMHGLLLKAIVETNTEDILQDYLVEFGIFDFFEYFISEFELENVADVADWLLQGTYGENDPDYMKIFNRYTGEERYKIILAMLSAYES